jgi:hypothetical protein
MLIIMLSYIVGSVCKCYLNTMHYRTRASKIKIWLYIIMPSYVLLLAWYTVHRTLCTIRYFNWLIIINIILASSGRICLWRNEKLFMPIKTKKGGTRVPFSFYSFAKHGWSGEGVGSFVHRPPWLRTKTSCLTTAFCKTLINLCVSVLCFFWLRESCSCLVRIG